MKVTLAKALKVKNQLTGRIAREQAQVRGYNRVIVENKDRHDVKGKYDNLLKYSADLIELKSAITRANQPIQEYILELAEQKSLLSILQSIPTDEGLEVTYEGNKIDYFAHLKREFVESEQERVKARIVQLQDLLDKHNAQTEIEIKDYLATI